MTDERRDPSRPAHPAESAVPPPATPLLEQIFQQMTAAVATEAIEPTTWEAFTKVLAAHARRPDLTIEALQDLIAAATVPLHLPESDQKQMLSAVTQSLWDDPAWRDRAEKFWTQLAETCK